MTDWTTALVWRDRDGVLHMRTDGDCWTDPDTYGGIIDGDTLARDHGPLTPVLDADGLPVVRTVGDLTNAHLGRRVKYGGADGYGREGVYQGTTADYPERDRCNMHVGGGYEAGVPMSTPCWVLP